MQVYLLLAPLLACVTATGYDPYYDLAQLYKMQLLANAFNGYSQDGLPMDPPSIEDPPYYPDLSELEGGDDGEGGIVKNSVYNDPFYSGAHARDQEHIEHSALHGYQSVSGGTAEGPGGNNQSKSDKPLPAYCNPPNPCPLGKTAEENCVENFENSAENNKNLLKEQDCPCDTEHMFSCPAGSATVSSKGQSSSQRMTLNKVIDQLSKAENNANNLESDSIVPSADRRVKLVAKKSPHVIHKRSEYIENSDNPFLKGPRKDIAAKKNHELSQNSIGWKLAELLDSQGENY